MIAVTGVLALLSAAVIYNLVSQIDKCEQAEALRSVAAVTAIDSVLTSWLAHRRAANLTNCVPHFQYAPSVHDAWVERHKWIAATLLSCRGRACRALQQPFLFAAGDGRCVSLPPLAMIKLPPSGVSEDAQDAQIEAMLAISDLQLAQADKRFQ